MILNKVIELEGDLTALFIDDDVLQPCDGTDLTVSDFQPFGAGQPQKVILYAVVVISVHIIQAADRTDLVDTGLVNVIRVIVGPDLRNGKIQNPCLLQGQMLFLGPDDFIGLDNILFLLKPDTRSRQSHIAQPLSSTD